MIKYLDESERWKTARTAVPNTAEFKPLKEALKSKNQATKKLLAAATAALSESVEGQPASKEEPIVPGDLYHGTLGGAGLLKTWEKTFDGSDKGAKLFGLLAWHYFFKHDTTWLAKAADTAGLGKQGWKYYVETKAVPAAAAVEKKQAQRRRRAASRGRAATAKEGTEVLAEAAPAPAAVEKKEGEPRRRAASRGRAATAAEATELPTEAAGMVLNQCVFWKTKKKHGRIVGEPRRNPADFTVTQQFLRFAPAMGEPVEHRQGWADSDNLDVVHQDNCLRIEPIK
jgi:hypothetical protein